MTFCSCFSSFFVGKREKQLTDCWNFRANPAPLQTRPWAQFTGSATFFQVQFESEFKFVVPELRAMKAKVEAAPQPLLESQPPLDDASARVLGH